MRTIFPALACCVNSPTGAAVLLVAIGIFSLRWGPIDGLPTYAQALKDHGKLATSLPEIERRIVNSEVNRLY